jgi:hypothetical protein
MPVQHASLGLTVVGAIAAAIMTYKIFGGRFEKDEASLRSSAPGTPPVRETYRTSRFSRRGAGRPARWWMPKRNA